MFDEEVMFFFFNAHPTLCADSTFRCPEFRLLFSTMMAMTLKWLDHIAIFQLGIGDVCAQRVQALIENDVYIYPGQWATDKDGKVLRFQ